MTSIQVSDREIEERARSIAYAAARAQLEQEKSAAAAQEAAAQRAHLQTVNAAEDRARELMTSLRSGYARRDELMSVIAPALEELMQIDAGLRSKTEAICAPMVGHWNSVGRNPRQQTPALRTAAGLPQWHDTVTRPSDGLGDRLAQLVCQLIASGALSITQGRIGAPDGSLVLTVGSETLVSK